MLLGLLPTFFRGLLHLWFLEFWTVPLEVAIFMAVSALEGQLFIVKFLVVMPPFNCEFYCFRETRL